MSNTQQYLRSYQLRVYNENNQEVANVRQDATNDYNGLNIRFRVHQNTAMVNDISEFHIYNLSAATKRLMTPGSFVTFEAGYQENRKQLFKGIVVNSFNNRQQPDYWFTLFCLDYIDKFEPIFLEIPSAYTDRQAIKAIASLVPGLIVNDSNLQGLTDTPIQTKVIVNHLIYWQAFEMLEKVIPVKIYITNGVLYSLPIKQIKPLNNPETITLNFKNGMIGSPIFEVAQAGVNVKALMNGDLTPGNVVTIQTLNPEIQLGQVNYARYSQDDITRGNYTIMSMDHYGESRGADWFSEIQGFGYWSEVKGFVQNE